jgi:RNA polymerase sigma factor (sigma-70 family)
MLRVKAGDLDRMSLLFERHHRSLYNFLFHMTWCKETSEDMVQTVFYRMLKYRHTFTGKGEFVIWMYHLGRNTLKDHIKKKKRAGRHHDIDNISEKLSGGDTADAQLERRQMQNELYRAMERLSEEEREILTLSKFQELKYNEIAELLNISEGAVKVRVHRAFNQLKSIYHKQGLI